MKNILCKMGFHKPDKFKFVTVKKQVRRHKWHRNYAICKRCGKLIGTVSFNKKVGKETK